MTQIQVKDLDAKAHRGYVIEVPQEVEIVTHRDERLEKARSDYLAEEKAQNSPLIIHDVVRDGLRGPNYKRIVITGGHYLEIADDAVVDIYPLK